MEDPEAWGSLKLNGVRVPGWWSVDLDNKWEIKKKKAKGSNGANLADLGRIPAEITLTGRIISAPDWAEIQNWLPQLTAERPAKRSLKDKSKDVKVKKGTRVTFDIDHPSARALSLRKIYFTLITSPKVDDTGVMTLVWRALEVKDPKEAKSDLNKRPAQLESNDATVVIEAARNAGRSLQSTEAFGEQGRPASVDEQYRTRSFGPPTLADKGPSELSIIPMSRLP